MSKGSTLHTLRSSIALCANIGVGFLPHPCDRAGRAAQEGPALSSLYTRSAYPSTASRLDYNDGTTLEESLDLFRLAYISMSLLVGGGQWNLSEFREIYDNFTVWFWSQS